MAASHPIETPVLDAELRQLGKTIRRGVVVGVLLLVVGVVGFFANLAHMFETYRSGTMGWEPLSRMYLGRLKRDLGRYPTVAEWLQPYGSSRHRRYMTYIGPEQLDLLAGGAHPLGHVLISHGDDRDLGTPDDIVFLMGRRATPRQTRGAAR
jgi:hypothetical protein